MTIPVQDIRKRFDARELEYLDAVDALVKRGMLTGVAEDLVEEWESDAVEAEFASFTSIAP